MKRFWLFACIWLASLQAYANLEKLECCLICGLPSAKMLTEMQWKSYPPLPTSRPASETSVNCFEGALFCRGTSVARISGVSLKIARGHSSLPLTMTKLDENSFRVGLGSGIFVGEGFFEFKSVDGSTTKRFIKAVAGE